MGSEFFTRDLLYNKDTHKQFITVEGRDGNIFYIVIDYDAPMNEEEEQYTTYFLNKVNEADLSALVEQGGTRRLHLHRQMPHWGGQYCLPGLFRQHDQVRR